MTYKGKPKGRDAAFANSPDLSKERAYSVEIAQEAGFQGVIISNTTIERPGTVDTAHLGAGGLSGAPLFESSTNKLSTLVTHFADSPLDFVGVGGIMTGPDAEAKRLAGAVLLQVYTGFVYGGPTFAGQLCAHLAQSQKRLKGHQSHQTQ